MPRPGDAVLVAGDASLRGVCNALRSRNDAVVMVAGAAEAIARLEVFAPDAILIDAALPDLDGFETCRRIKSHRAWAHVPVIVMLESLDADAIAAGFRAGATDFVAKPVRAAEVLARLDLHLRNARAARLARDAVELGGQALVVADGQGRVAWGSPRAQRWIAAFFGDEPGESVRRWLRAAPARDDRSAAIVERRRNGHVLAARRLGNVGRHEAMWLLSLRADAASMPSRIDSAALTPRETEVLSWVAKGKTNRDVAEILALSPRTVNKHLEHVFEKLGVETRAAAAVLASRALL